MVGYNRDGYSQPLLPLLTLQTLSRPSTQVKHSGHKAARYEGERPVNNLFVLSISKYEVNNRRNESSSLPTIPRIMHQATQVLYFQTIATVTCILG